MSDEERVAKAPIRDEKRLEALEAAEQEHGSMAAALRHALDRLADASETEAETDPTEVDVPAKALEGYWELVDWADVGGRIEIGTAESVLANALNIPKPAVRSRVIKPLVNESLLWKDWGHDGVWLVVGRRDGEPLNAPEQAPTPEASPTSSEAATDGGDPSDRLDELAAAGAEVGE
ncbi:hypothetical protein C470_03586 [Halorubrum distributum JCM 13561]|uniref:Uncharacterized protein n=1 Tax=Halorubrum distributum JCM 13561 TaxID=1227483 RepID=M0P030_9EURY|nr:hypothetical protein [Halorubrum litoreum]EMA63178.1 hypothetical protein C470_03586 [Halorubrum litoreum JCM 13561]